jgi:hypothetical protein
MLGDVWAFDLERKERHRLFNRTTPFINLMT